MNQRAAVGRDARPPTAQELGSHAMRSLAGVAFVVLAAVLVHRMGHAEYQWQFLAIAGAVVPQVLVDTLAINDPERRSRLRTSLRPAPVPMLGAVALLIAADATFVPGNAASATLAAAAVCAAVGLVVVASPKTITFAPRSR